MLFLGNNQPRAGNCFTLLNPLNFQLEEKDFMENLLQMD